jgi:hypothetical protein
MITRAPIGAVRAATALQLFVPLCGKNSVALWGALDPSVRFQSLAFFNIYDAVQIRDEEPIDPVEWTGMLRA